MDELKELVLKHEREISELTAIQKVLTKQVSKMTETLEAVKEAIAEINIAIQEQKKELKTAIEVRDKIEALRETLLTEKENQKATTARIFTRIEKVESEIRELKQEIEKLSESTAFAQWLGEGFSTLSKKAAVFVLLALVLMILGVFLGIDLHSLIRK